MTTHAPTSPPDSSISWLDASEDERRRVLEVVDMSREHDTIDELGIGLVRDALSDLLFPGFSVARTRARYLIFVPRMYAELELLHHLE